MACLRSIVAAQQKANEVRAHSLVISPTVYWLHDTTSQLISISSVSQGSKRPVAWTKVAEQLGTGRTDNSVSKKWKGERPHWFAVSLHRVFPIGFQCPSVVF